MPAIYEATMWEAAMPATCVIARVAASYRSANIPWAA
jgi:hypothetical protein